jgi:hypothetical protein
MQEKKKRGRPFTKNKARVYPGDEALQKILSTDLPPELQEKIKEPLMNMRRHLKGALQTVEEFLHPFAPKCHICYEKYGYLTKCVCLKEIA